MPMRLAAPKMLNERRICACTAERTFSATLILAKMLLTWKAREMPRRAIRCGARLVMSRPSNTTLPASQR